MRSPQGGVLSPSRRRHYFQNSRLLPVGLVMGWIIIVLFTREAWVFVRFQKTMIKLGARLSNMATSRVRNTITSDSLVKNWELANAPQVMNRTSQVYCDFLKSATKKIASRHCVHLSKKQRTKPLRLVLGTCVGGAGSWELYWRLRQVGLLVEHEGLGLDGSVSWLFAVRKPKYPCRRGRQVRNIRFRKVVQLVRCPPANIAALATHRLSTLTFAANAVQGSDSFAPPPDSMQVSSEKENIDFSKRANTRLQDPLWLKFFAELWLRWNERIEKYADLILRVEDELYQNSALIALLCRHDRCHSPRSAARISRFRDSFREASNRFFRNGLYNPTRCLRGSCDHTSEHNASRLHHRPHGDLNWRLLKTAAGPSLSRRIAVAAARYGYTLNSSATTGATSCRIF
mmetsp:Transcript_2243/g.3539  ORF Transcript_2243/g.3539 Transcript_2243/m.3539 type:complete len:401 (+) Transcript_2243:53-1255(+)